MSNHQILVEEPSLNIETLDVKDNTKTETEENSTNNSPLHIPKSPNEIYLIFRKQLSKDTILLIDKTKIKTVGEIINILLTKLKISKEDKYIRLFFKGRPLKPEEEINIISNLNNIIIYNYYL